MHQRSVHIFDLYEHPEAGLIAVRRGFSWEGFLLPAVWAVRHGMGWTAVTLMVLTTAVFDLARLTAEVGFGPVEQFVFMLAGITLLGIKPGVDGYLWIGEKRVCEAYVHRGAVAASGRRKAVQAMAGQRFTDRPIVVAA
ncbi:MAG: hypothetical protein V2I57_02950 [Xanthomonadales bacterium]|jgi:hypothetical protein|nr:hypothetical protein [Xanthomonadales bacterium]